MSPKDEKLDLLKSIPLFAGFGRRELERLGMLTDQLDLPAGRVLMRQGEAGHEAFVIVRGRAEIARDGRVIAERGNGEILHEITRSICPECRAVTAHRSSLRGPSRSSSRPDSPGSRDRTSASRSSAVV